MKVYICYFICILLTACHNTEQTEVELRQPDDTNQIFLPVSINGKKGYFMFDTGAEKSAIHSKWAEEIGITPSDSITVDYYFHSEKQAVSEKVFFQIKDILSYQTCILSDQSFFQEYDYNGTIGMDMISRYYWWFDLTNNRVTISEHPIQYETDSTRQPLKISYQHPDSHIPVISIPVDDSLSVNMIFDTGHSINRLYLNEDLYREEISFKLSGQERPLYQRLKTGAVPGHAINVYVDNQYMGMYKKQLHINGYSVADTYWGIFTDDYFEEDNNLDVHGTVGIWFVRRFSAMYIDPVAQQIELSVSPQDTTVYQGQQGFDTFLDKGNRIDLISNVKR